MIDWAYSIKVFLMFNLMIFCSFFAGYIYYPMFNTDEIMIGNNSGWNQTNYYNLDYFIRPTETEFIIKNPCIKIEKYIGISMKPWWEEKGMIIVDTCFPNENLKVGDVIVFDKGFGDGRVQHRIKTINFEDRWIIPQGDNNPLEDDYVGFDYVYGKTIGFLNIADNNSNSEQNFVTYNFTSNPDLMRFNITTICLCSTKCAMKFCDNKEQINILKYDSFIQSAGLTEQNCEECDNNE